MTIYDDDTLDAKATVLEAEGNLVGDETGLILEDASETLQVLLSERQSAVTQLITIHRDLATARRNANLPPQLNTLGTDLQSVQARLEALVTSLGGGVYLEGEGWRR